MDAVVEVDKVRQVMHARPAQRLVLTEARANRLEVGTRIPDLGVAVDAGLGRRDARRRRDFNRRVAVAALDANAAGVMLVAELDRLLDESVRGRHEIRSLQRHDQRAEQAENDDESGNAGFRPRVSAFWEYLRHAIQ